MTTRNITKQFETLRSKAKSQHEAINGAISFSKQHGQPGGLLPTDNIDSSSPQNDLDVLTAVNPPKWVDITDTIRTEIEKIDTMMTQLENAYSQRLKVSFGNDEEEKVKEVMIENITHQTTLLIKGIESKIKSIAFCDAQDELSNNEKNVRLNVMRNLGASLHTKSKAFKQQQRDYLQRLQKQQHIGNDLFADITTKETSEHEIHDLGTMLDVALEEGLTDEQQRELEEIEQRADEKEKEIISLVQNINELASLFQELNVLVIEQGTILDRIDYSVEQTLINVQKGHEVINQAEEKSSANWILKFMIILIAIIGLEIVALIVKWKLRG